MRGATRTGSVSCALAAAIVDELIVAPASVCGAKGARPACSEHVRVRHQTQHPIKSSLPIISSVEFISNLHTWRCALSLPPCASLLGLTHSAGAPPPTPHCHRTALLRTSDLLCWSRPEEHKSSALMAHKQRWSRSKACEGHVNGAASEAECAVRVARLQANNCAAPPPPRAAAGPDRNDQEQNKQHRDTQTYTRAGPPSSCR